MPERISLTSTGAEPDAPSYAPTVSSDGRYVMFTSRAGNLLPGMPPASQQSTCENPILPQWYVFDRQTKTLERVTRASDGSPAQVPPQPTSCTPVFSQLLFEGYISANGRYASYLSAATNLRPGDTSVRVRILRFDRETGDIDSVALSASGQEFSRDLGSYFGSDAAANLHLFGCRQVIGLGIAERLRLCLKDLRDGSVRPAVLGRDGDPYPGRDSGGFPPVAFSGDGRYVVYLTADNNFLPELGNGKPQFVRYELATGKSVVVSRRRDGRLSEFIAQSTRVSELLAAPPSVSFDGSVISFPARDAGPPSDEFSPTVSSVAIWRESVGYMETAGDLETNFPTGFALFPSLSDNGKLLLYGNSDSDLDFPPPGIERGGLDLWLHRTEREGPAGRFVRTRTGATPGSLSSRLGHCDVRIGSGSPMDEALKLYNRGGLNCPRLSGSGNLAVFITRANDLIPGDTNRGLTPAQTSDILLGREALDIYAVPITDLRDSPPIPVPFLSWQAKQLMAALVMAIGAMTLFRQRG